MLETFSFQKTLTSMHFCIVMDHILNIKYVQITLIKQVGAV